MYWKFDAVEWKEKIKDPLWYMAVPALFKRMSTLHDADRQAYETEKVAIYDFFEKELVAGNIALGNAGSAGSAGTGKDLDAERKPIDTIVIHHTSNPPGMTKERLSGIEVVRLYAPQFAGKGPTYDANNEIKGEPIYSGHFRDGIQVFWPYHWMVRTDGTCERLLLDNEIGWQAGNWDVNCRSVAIVFDNDYEDGEPSERELAAAASLIREHYPQVSKENIFGHCEINKKTTCPSKFFLSAGNGWKKKLLCM
jgi:hypothetical protein